MPNRNLSLIVLVMFGLLVFSAACKPKVEPEITPEEPEVVSQPAEPEQPEEPPVEVIEDFKAPEPDIEQIEPTAAELMAQGVLKTVYFDFDKSDLTSETRGLLRANADWLMSNTKWSIVVEGHCDERGTIEYNLSLGQRRARAVQDYLASLGVQGSRMRTKTFGEEKPVDPGHSEAAWAKNRRAEFVIE